MNIQQPSLFKDQSPTFDEVMGAWGERREWLSRLQICEKLGRAKSPAMIAVIGVLVGMNYLLIRPVVLPNRVTMYEYMPSEKWDRDGTVQF